MLRPHGQLVLTEVDNETFQFAPGCEAITEWWRRFSLCQAGGGGDPWVGQSLSREVKELGAVDFISTPSQTFSKIPNYFLHYLDDPESYVPVHPFFRK